MTKMIHKKFRRLLKDKKGDIQFYQIIANNDEYKKHISSKEKIVEFIKLEAGEIDSRVS